MKTILFFVLVSSAWIPPGISQSLPPRAVQWQRVIGGSRPNYSSSIHQTPDHGFILGATSASSPGSSKTSSNFGSNDFWIVKLNPKGLIEWERSFGGNNDDSLTVTRVTRDGGFILGGYSASQQGGNKTSPNFGNYDFW
jgi:hypothetical protein